MRLPLREPSWWPSTRGRLPRAALGLALLLPASAMAGVFDSNLFEYSGMAFGIGGPWEAEFDTFTSADRPALGTGLTLGSATSNLRLLEVRLPLFIVALRAWTGLGFADREGFRGDSPTVWGLMSGASFEVGPVDKVTGYVSLNWVYLGSPAHTGNDRVSGSIGLRFYVQGLE